MNQTGYQGVGNALLMVPVAGVSEGTVEGLKATWVRASDHTTGEAVLAYPVEEYALSNERLLAYAARNPPPQSWYDEDEGLF